MNFELEEKFINDYINPSYCNRLLYELKSSNKRLNALMRFSHDIDNIIKKDKIVLTLKSFDENTLGLFLKELNFYVISFKYLDGIIMNKSEVIEYIYNEYSPVIVCGNNILLIKKEFEKGNNNYYLLKNT